VSVVVICAVAFVASGLTFFSGFGLGTLLLPAFALFFPIEQSVAMTGLVHFLNGLLKLGLVGRHAHLPTVMRFGLPAIAASFLGAMLLIRLDDLSPLLVYELFGRTLQITPIKLTIGCLLLVFSAFELSKRLQGTSFSPRYMPLGGLLSGFFGGLSGMQGALRSAFLIHAGLTKEGFVGTGAVIAALIDVSRLGVYSTSLAAEASELNYALLGGAVTAAFAGAFIGNRILNMVTMVGVQRLVGVLLLLVAVSLIAGVL
jgi:uncharacterized membrane protein YfcA